MTCTIRRPAWTVVAVLFAILAAGPRSIAAAQPASSIFRLVTFDAGAGPRLGATEGNGTADVVDIHNAIRALAAAGQPAARDAGYIPIDMKALIEAGDGAVAAVRSVYGAAVSARNGGTLADRGGPDRVFYPASAVRLKPPVTNPSKVFGMAGNYPREGDLAHPKFPSAFFKSVASLIGQDETIDLAGLVTKGFHEGELAVVIGRRARNVTEAQALDYVIGYTIHNDVSARDLPMGEHPSQGSAMSKGLDTFGPLGPYLTLKADVPDPHNLAIEVRLNGEPWTIPNANTRNMTFKIPQLIAYLSQRLTLLPGDVVSTGVPAPVVPLRAGDTVEISVERLGTLRNRVLVNGSRATEH